ncbi:LysR family transcriptional regulator [Bordetella genomosp. 11]|uniref:LysR family transcriptional regulator n=1 Tax=Bordetella genomosp. 11 TaxID=1416808 RepID=A0A261UZK4_9BORD|nr:LysR family transcriptional regulator [Bordetella genomosp. 11]OZI66997.1 LysR family transcriptional regulator [Bordetella genomosp. 11]
MLEAISLDQLRTFVAAAETGSFSAAGRQLRRAQSVISHTLANLEAQTGVKLFDRTGRYPVLTDAGRALLQEARGVLQGMNAFKAKAKSMSDGLEPELTAVIDVMYPMQALTKAVGGFRVAFPHTPLRLYVEALGGVAKPVLDGTCALGVIGSLPTIPNALQAEMLLDVPMVKVVAPSHPLASVQGEITLQELSKHVQLVLTDRTDLTEGNSYGVFSPLTWRLADMGAKHAFLCAGFGWGHMPLAMVQAQILSGELVALTRESADCRVPPIPVQAVYRHDNPPGPAGRWFLEQLKDGSRACPTTLTEFARAGKDGG